MEIYNAPANGILAGRTVPGPVIRRADLALDPARCRFIQHPNGTLALVYAFDGPARLVTGTARYVTFHDEPRCIGFVVGLYPA